MIGLQFICDTYGMEYKTLATKLGVTPQYINAWLRGKRKISKERIEQLSKIFPRIPSEFFQKELLKSEQLTVQEIYFTETDEWEEVEIEEYDEETQTAYSRVINFSQNQGLIELVHREQEEQEMLERFWKLYEDGEDFHRNQKMIDKFFSILEISDERQIDFLRMVFYYLRNEKQWGFDPFFAASTKRIEKAEKLHALMKEDWFID